MVNLTVYIQTKQSDLECLTALHTIQTTVPQFDLARLVRYVVWDIEISGDLESAKTHVDSLLNDTYFLMNPNKETATLLFPTQDMMSLMVSMKQNHISPGKLQLIQKQVSSDIQQISRSILWGIDGPSLLHKNPIVLQDECEQWVLPILCNTIFEKYTLYHPHSIQQMVNSVQSH